MTGSLFGQFVGRKVTTSMDAIILVDGANVVLVRDFNQLVVGSDRARRGERRCRVERDH